MATENVFIFIISGNSTCSVVCTINKHLKESFAILCKQCVLCSESERLFITGYTADDFEQIN